MRPMPHRPLSLSRRKLLTATAVASLSPLAAWAQGAAWPQRPLRLIVPFSAGGAADTSARALAQKAGEFLGQPVTIENRTGGNAVVAANATLSSPKDGYTFLWDAANQLTNPVLLKDLSFDYRSAFVPITMGVRAPQALVVRQDFPARTLAEFLAYVRSKPDTVSVGTPPAGAMGHLAVALLSQRAGVRLVHTPYRGGAEAARDVMGGQIDAALITTATARGTLDSGRTRILAVTSAQRVAAFADIPTIAESGLPGYDMDDWFALFAAAGTPQAPMQRLQAAFAQAAKDPGVAERLTAAGFVPVANGTEEFQGWLAKQRPLLQKLIQDAHITL